MFSGIKPTGSFPISGTAPYHTHTPAAGAKKIERQNYDQFQCSPRPEGEEARIQETVSRLSRQARTRPSHSQLQQLQQQIKDGTYQPDAREIAARMLLMDQEDG